MSPRKIGLSFCCIVFCLVVTVTMTHSHPYVNKLRDGWNFLGKGQVSRSGLAFSEAVNMDPQHPAARLSLAVALSLQRDWKSALSEYQAVLSLSPRDALAWNGMGIAHLQQAQSVEALTCFEKALEIDPDYLAARSHLAFALCLHNLPDRALEECEKVMKSRPNIEVRGFAHKTRALAFLLKGHPDEALRALDAAWRDAYAPRAKAFSWLSLVDPRAAFTAVAHPLFISQKLPEHRLFPQVPNAGDGGSRSLLTPKVGAPSEQKTSPSGNSAPRVAPFPRVTPPSESKPAVNSPTLIIEVTPSEGTQPFLVRGTVKITATAVSARPIRYVSFSLGGRSRAIINVLPYEWNWNTRVDGDGDHELTVRVQGAMGDLLGEKKVVLRVRNGAEVQDVKNNCDEMLVQDAHSNSNVGETFSNEDVEFARQHARPILSLTAQPNALRFLKAKIYQSQEKWQEAYDALMSVYVDDPFYLDVRAQVLTLRDRIYKVPLDDVLEFQSAPALGNVVALTFDDGPRPFYTETVLATLRQHNVKATFFVVGKMVDQYPELARQIVKEGHEIASHSYLHFNMERMTPLSLEMELLRCEHAVRRATGKEIRLFRPPGGRYDEDVRQAIIGLGYKTIFWTSNITSYPLLHPHVIADKLTEKVGPGGVVLLHNGMDKSIYVLPKLLQILKERGTQCVTVGQMLDMQKRR